jgi:NTE family protein
MTGAANAKAPARTEIGLVLQGGGALGAYEWGAITALFDVIDEAGVSIGAVNVACVVGATTAPTRAAGSARCGAIS